ncbi:MAG: hypothetical protein JNL11_17645 [Bdellovibrionaceae bacterium]|nr:hypothetical protein [Pseudobdellovibrionaceae bacterium]
MIGNCQKLAGDADVALAIRSAQSRQEYVENGAKAEEYDSNMQVRAGRARSNQNQHYRMHSDRQTEYKSFFESFEYANESSCSQVEDVHRVPAIIDGHIVGG